MKIGLGMLILCIIFIMFGSKTEESSVLYYDMEEADSFNEGSSKSKQGSKKKEEEEDGEGEEEDREPTNSEEENTDAAEMAKQIYDDIEL